MVMSLLVGAAGGAGRLAGAGFRMVARARGARALHPQGTVVRGTLLREGLRDPIGVSLTDEPGEDEVLVRFSRAMGLPAPLPDIQGLAIRLTGPDHRPQDLLLSGTGRLPGLRHLLLPTREPAHTGYTSVVPFRTPSGPVMVGAFPLGDGALRLAVARTVGPWCPFALLLLGDGAADGSDGPGPAGYAELPDGDQVAHGSTATADLGAFPDPTMSPDPDLIADPDLVTDPVALFDPDPIADLDGNAGDGRLDVDFDPVRHPVPGLEMLPGLARLRVLAYAGSRRGRHDDV